jgi:hypothetical protein
MPKRKNRTFVLCPVSYLGLKNILYLYLFLSKYDHLG